jgi:hypothetical protein
MAVLKPWAMGKIRGLKTSKSHDHHEIDKSPLGNSPRKVTTKNRRLNEEA